MMSISSRVTEPKETSYRVDAVAESGWHYGDSYMGGFDDEDEALDKAELLHRSGYSVIVYKHGQILCEYEQ